jgi:tetratricopeptide (TPR) repeat protein
VTSESVPDLFERGFAAHRAGDAASAERDYRAVIDREPGHADALHLLGLLASDGGRHREAETLIQQALVLRPLAAAFHANLGLARMRAGRPERAAEAYRRSVELAPGHAPTLAKLGRALDAAGQPGRAIEVLREAVAADADDAGAWNALGVAQVNGDELARARESLRRALSLDPVYGEARANLANLCRLLWDRDGTQGDLDSAAELVSLAPEDPDAHFRMALALSGRRRLEESRASYERALALRPDHPETLNNLAHVLLALGDAEGAVALLRRAIGAREDYRDAWYNLGVTLQSLDRIEEAQEVFERVTARWSDHADSWNNLGGTLLALGQCEAAAKAYERAGIENPGHCEARWNLGLARLTMGDFERGWEGYEARLGRGEYRGPDGEMWDGGETDGPLLIWAEQGLGDTIQFSRYLPVAAARAGPVVFECQPPLVELFAGRWEKVAVIARGTGRMAYERHCPLLSLPRLLGTRVDTIPPVAGCNTAPAELLARWRVDGPGVRVGVVWGANPNHPLSRIRSIPGALMGRLADVPGVTVVSLQRGPQAAERHPAVRELDRDGLTIMDTAAMMSGCDVVVTVDTMTAHLAGTLGVRTWVLLPFAADWRWLREGSTSAWYPGVRLYRQPGRGEWLAVIDRIRRDLEQLACRPATAVPALPSTRSGVREIEGRRSPDAHQ